MFRGASLTHQHLRDRVVAILVATIGVDVICTALAYAFEHDAAQTEVRSIGTAAFWATTQLLTVSSQLKNPVTTPGRILDVFMEIWALTVITSLAGALGSFFHRRSRERGAAV